jgi:hypothetical protein
MLFKFSLFAIYKLFFVDFGIKLKTKMGRQTATTTTVMSVVFLNPINLFVVVVLESNLNYESFRSFNNRAEEHGFGWFCQHETGENRFD